MNPYFSIYNKLTLPTPAREETCFAVDGAWGIPGARRKLFTEDQLRETAYAMLDEFIKQSESSTQRKPLTGEMKARCPYTAASERGAFYDGWLSAEAAHGIKEGDPPKVKRLPTDDTEGGAL